MGSFRHTRALVGAASLLFCAATAAEPQPGGEYRVPLNIEPSTLDPARYTDIHSMAVAANLYDGLVQFDDQLKVVPAIASIWKISRDSRTYTFILRDDVKFHHGRIVTADDFVFSFSRILHPDTESPVTSLFLKIKGAQAYRRGEAAAVAGLRAPQPHLLQIELEEPFAPFLSILAMINAKVVPHDLPDLDLARRPIGTGPFRLADWRPGERITLTANGDYFAGAPYLDGLRFVIYTDGGAEQIFADFQQGKLDQAPIPRGLYERVMASSGDYSVVSQPGLNVTYVGLNTRVAPLDDARVRRALNHAVDTDRIVDNIHRGTGVPARGILPPGIAGFNPDFPGYSYAPDQARALLAEAGYPDGVGFPPLQLWIVSKSDHVRQTAQAIRGYLAELGVKVEVRSAANWKTFKEVIASGQAGLFYAAWHADYPDPDNFFFPLAHSTSQYNRMRFSEPDIDKLIEQARVEIDYLQRAQLYRQAEQLVMSQAPIISLHTASTNYVFQPWVRGVQTSRLGSTYLPYRKIWFDPQRTQISQRGATDLAVTD